MKKPATIATARLEFTGRRWIGAGCAAACLLTSPVVLRAEVTDEQFRQLQEVVKQLVDKVQKLEQTHTKDEEVHARDVEQIKNLQGKIEEAQKTANVAASKADAVATLPPPGVPAGPVVAQPINLIATDTLSVNRNFLLSGDAEALYAKGTGRNGAFQMADFAPIFLYRANENILFEAGFDFILQNNAPNSPGATTTVNLSFAQLDYLLNDYATLIAGNMLLPLGEYSERGAGWLNKIPDTPLGRDLLPGAGVGAQVRGAIPLTDRGISATYAVWGVNGPSSADGTAKAGSLDLGGNVGLRSDNAIANLHGNPSGGARVGFFLPYKPHFDLEVGFSGQAGEWDDLGQHLWSAAVVDASLHLGAAFEIRGEYIRTHYGSDDVGNVSASGYWVQTGYKLAGLSLDLPVVRNTELVYRYDAENTGLGTVQHRNTLGFIYYFTNTLLFEGDYEFLHSTDPGGQGYQYVGQLSYGF